MRRCRICKAPQDDVHELSCDYYLYPDNGLWEDAPPPSPQGRCQVCHLHRPATADGLLSRHEASTPAGPLPGTRCDGSDRHPVTPFAAMETTR